MATKPLLAIVIVLVSAGASFFFALAETALFSLSKWQGRQLAERGTRGRAAAGLLARSQDVLATMVLGNTFANAAMLASALWMALQDYWPEAITILGVFVLSLIGCEVLPKTLAVRQPDVWALRVALPLLWFEKAAMPLRWVAQKANFALLRFLVPASFKPQGALTDADYQELLDMAYQQGTLAESEREIILQIINLDRRMAKDVMVPRSRMASISDDLSVEEMIAAAQRLRYRRLPIYDETPDAIVGILNTRKLMLDPTIDLADAIELPSFVPETMNLLQLLKSFQRQHRAIAIVVDEFGGTAGMVTTEDIMNELVGTARAGSESEGLVIEKLGPGRWRASGTMRLDDFRREYPQLGDVAEVETVGGLLAQLLNVIPAQGESATFRGLRLTAQAVDERRVREVLVEQVK
jgi:CBS domain containing-hemolysin-like protein